MSDGYSDDNIIDIDGARSVRRGSGYHVRKPKKKPLYWLRPSHIGAFVFVVILAYLLINLYIYMHKDEVSVFEVQAEELNTNNTYTGIAIRDEQVITADHTGYINYYIGNGRRVAKNSIIFSIDNGSDIYDGINESYEQFSLTNDEISGIKDMISRYMNSYDSTDIKWISQFQTELTETVYDYVNENMIERMESLRSSGISRSSFYVCRSGSAGVVSYRTDSLSGLTAAQITPDMFAKNYRYSQNSLRVNGLVGAGDQVCRLCSNEQWSIVCMIPESFYIKHLESKNISIFLDDRLDSIPCTLKVWQSGTAYFAQVSFDSYMSEYINDRYVTVTFDEHIDPGLKIPATSVASKPYYLIPLSCFSTESGYGGYVLKVEEYDPVTGAVSGYRCVYPSKFFSDGFYAYIETSLLGENATIYNPDSGERVRAAAVSYLDGVYTVNKGYYQFVRIEKLRQNSEYVIIKSNTAGGLRRYDHIALDANDAIEGAIIY